MTVIYSVYDDNEESGGSSYFATKEEAIRYARENASGKDFDLVVTKNTVVDLPIRQLAIRLLTGSGWCAKSEDVYTVKGTFKEDA